MLHLIWYVVNGVRQIAWVHRVARGAGGEDADGGGIFFLREAGEFRHGGSGVRDGRRLQNVRFVKPLTEPRLPAFFQHRAHLATGHVGDEQFDRVGADINDGAADGFHSSQITVRAAGSPIENVTFRGRCARRG